jgi:branched-chain amino acid aminotransferase
LNDLPKFAWLDGAVVPWAECRLHARSQGAFWGANVFEGVRAYWDAPQNRLLLFRLQDHLSRLRRSAKCVRMTLPYSDEDLIKACSELLLANRFMCDVHVVVAACFGVGPNCDSMGLTDAVNLHITAIPMPRSRLFREGAAVGVSSWRRISDDTMPPRIKTGANYHNSRLAQQEALRAGYDVALLLNQRGTLAEAPGSCIAVVHDGSIQTPPGTSGVLEGITLATVAEMAGELNVPFARREIDRTEMYLADEAFLCGTLAEIQPIVSIDGLAVGRGKVGPVTLKLQEAFERRVRTHPLPEWSHPVSVRGEFT